jgi:hypothetical protein
MAGCGPPAPAIDDQVFGFDSDRKTFGPKRYRHPSKIPRGTGYAARPGCFSLRNLGQRSPDGVQRNPEGSKPRTFQVSKHSPGYGSSPVDYFPSAGIIMIAWRQGPHRVQAIGKNHPGGDAKRFSLQDVPNGIPQIVDAVHQQG